MSTLAHQYLKTHFGYDEFRGEQKEIIQNVVDGGDTLVIMPTGGGKSLCYQLPALLSEGTAIVVSPLIALMQDQVESLKANGIAAGALNSSTPAEEANDIVKNLGTEALKLLYVSPEKAVSRSFMELIKDKKISLIAIDEAHCVSIWGNDFRQEYTYLPRLTKSFQKVPVIALTATADRSTQDDISEKLQLTNSKKFISSFERKNLEINVKPAMKRLDSIVSFVKKRKDESGIIYCLSRKSTEMVAERLRNEGINAFHYHAELSAPERNGVQRAFQQDEIKVVCATIAFGMGIDKSNVRFVLHYNMPKNLESYYQEIGRAGRDGLPSETLLFFSLNDSQILRQFIDDSEADDSFKMVQRAKLSRMIEFCQATSCRTNMILSYFGEHRTEPCGHCDNCKHPPLQFDGTIIAQKALSAVKRLNERVATQMLVDILRGSERKEILQGNFHKIKTFGAGSDIPREEWLHYVSQLVNMGYLEIDYKNYNSLKLTALANKVLFDGFKVNLSKVRAYKADKQSKEKPQHHDSSLFDKLRKLRMTFAKMENVPAYIIFNDATLHEMAAASPVTLDDMEEISGVGKHKLKKYGDAFIKEIKEHSGHFSTSDIEDPAIEETFQLYSEGLSAEAIAKKKNEKPDIIYSHLLHLYKKNKNIHLHDFVNEDEITAISQAWYKLKNTEDFRELYDYMNEEYSYYKIRFALAFLSDNRLIEK